MDRSDRPLTVSVVSPVYRAESHTLRELHQRLSAVADASDCRFEFIYVDDASPDRTWEWLTQLARDDPRVVALRLAENVRQTRAIFAGTEVAAGDAIVVMDSDLEDPPEFVAELLEAFRAGHDLVVASRRRPGSPKHRRIGSAAMRIVAGLAGLSVADVGSSFLIMSRSIEAGVRAELDRSGVQLLLPTNFALSERPLTLEVTAPFAARSSYSARVLARLGGEFFGRYVARRAALPVLAAGLAAGAGLAYNPRATRRRPRSGAAVTVATVACAGVLAWLPERRRPDQGNPLYVVAERVDGAHSSLG